MLTYAQYAYTKLQSKAYQGGKEEATLAYKLYVEEPTTRPTPVGE
jgi:hypothetical protein